MIRSRCFTVFALIAGVGASPELTPAQNTPELTKVSLPAV
jgi:hypothetical protein